MTTGQPIKVPSDRNKFNNEFMENLRLQIKLNDQNLQANRLYLSTGQLPPSTQMADTRSTAEKLADIEGLKRSIVADLSPIAETSFAFAIIDGVINSPLNIDNSLFRYLAQNAPQIGQQLSKKYKFGISGDANDVSIIVNFLEDAYNKTRNTFQTIKGYMNSTTNIRNTNTNLQDQLISELRYFLQRIKQLENTETVRNDEDMQLKIQNIGAYISEILYVLPNAQQMNRVLSDLTNMSFSKGKYITPNDDLLNPETGEFNRRHPDYNEDLINSIYDLYGAIPDTKYDEALVNFVIEAIEKLPNPDYIRTLLNNVEKGIKTHSVNIINQSLQSLKNLFNEWVEDDVNNPTPFQEKLREFRSKFLEQVNEELEYDRETNRINTISQINEMNKQRKDNAKAQRVYVINPYDDPVHVTSTDNFGGGEEEDESTVLQRQKFLNQYNKSQGIQSTTSDRPLTAMKQRRIYLSNPPEYSTYDPANPPEYSTYDPDPDNPIYRNLGLNLYDVSDVSSERSFNPYELGGINPTFNEVLSGQNKPETIFTHQDIYPESKEEYGYLSEEKPPIIQSSNPAFRPRQSYESSERALSNYLRNKDIISRGVSSKETLFNLLKDSYYSEVMNDPDFIEFTPQGQLLAKNPYSGENPLHRKAPPVPKSKETITRNRTLSKARTDLKNFYKKQAYLNRETISKNIDYDKLQNDIDNIIYYDENEPLVDVQKKLDILMSRGLRGEGIKKGRGISSDYREFGINKINHKKLNDGILTIRRKSNVNIPDMPSKRISRKLQKIITHISGGGIPDFNDINNLDDSEKDYLHKLISKSNLNDRLSVPAPSKDQEEKDYHQFEVMKGEIMSGNDSKELVKKFKVLILKLSKQKVLPATEVNELLHDLLALGY